MIKLKICFLKSRLGGDFNLSDVISQHGNVSKSSCKQTKFTVPTTSKPSTAADAAVTAAVTADLDCEQALSGVATQTANSRKMNSSSRDSGSGSGSGSGNGTITT